MRVLEKMGYKINRLDDRLLTAAYSYLIEGLKHTNPPLLQTLRAKYCGSTN